jgi:beta-glucanase (GH16 family)
MAGYSEVYSSDFTGSTLPSAWDLYSGQPGGDPGAMFSNSAVTVANGLLNINAIQQGGQWVTGGLCQCNSTNLTYGAYFVRSRMTGAGPTGVELLWPADGNWPPEIDFNETYGTTSSTMATLHYSSSNQQIQHSLSIDMTQWHTWGVIWTPSSITYTVDGAVWATVTNAADIPNTPMYLSLQTQTWCASDWACPTSPQSLQVDWVAEYSPNS